jgi:hypothetical protein
MMTLALLLSLALQVGQRLYIDEVSESFQKRWAAAEESRAVKDLLDLYAVAHDSFPGRLAQPDPAVPRWIPLRRVLAAKLASLPASALEPHEVIARQVLETVLEPVARRKAIEKYAYTQAGREALDLMANVDGDQGRLPVAMRGWSRELEVRLSAQTAARLGLAHAMRNDGVALSTLRAQAEARALKGELTVAGRKRELFEYLDSLKSTEAKPLQTPAAELEAASKSDPAPNAEIPLGHYDLKDDGRYGSQLAVAIPAIGRAGDRELILITNGLRLIAIDPARAEGGRMEEAVEWRFPKDNPVRTYTLGGYNNTSLPYVGAVISGDHAYCTMFSKAAQTHQQVGKRPERFEGPAAIRAFTLATGELLWDTETLEIPVDGEPKPLMEAVLVGQRNFCFGGPPIVRGNRLYAAVMTSPYTERQCWALCLNAEDGHPIWCTNVASAPSSKESRATVSFAEEDGTLVLLTNFGVAAALDSATGGFEWLVKYPNAGRVRYSCSPPIIAGSLVYLLAQDCDELLAFDRWTGLEAPLPKLSEEVSWEGVVHLLGHTGDWLVLSGTKNLAIRPLDGRVVNLPDGESGRLGRGTIWGDRLYLPTRNDLSIFDTATWKLSQSIKWTETSNPGNLLITGSLCLHLSDRLDLYTDADLLRKRFASQVNAMPPKPLECRQLARILENAGRVKESVVYYRRAFKVWESDPAWQESAEGMKKKLADLETKLGDDYPKE